MELGQGATGALEVDPAQSAGSGILTRPALPGTTTRMLWMLDWQPTAQNRNWLKGPAQSQRLPVDSEVMPDSGRALLVTRGEHRMMPTIRCGLAAAFPWPH